jgi:hypothetical protein
MSEDTNELKKILAENGNFDAEKADRDVDAANSIFDSQLKRGARITLCCYLFVIALLEFAFVGFVLTFSTKALVGFAILLVITIVLIVLFSIQFEISNTKLSLLREIKLLRLERMGMPSDQTIAPIQKTTPTGASLWHVLSLRENMTWFVALILLALAVNYSTVRLMDWGLRLTEESQVTLLADGSGTVVNKVSYRYQGFWPMTSYSLLSGDPSYTIKQWLDGQGRDLPVSVSTVDGNRQFSVQFAEPIMPGDQVNYTTTAERRNMATKQGNTWTYQGGQKWGGKGQKFYLETIRLPPSAEIVSVEPKPAQQFVRDGQQTVRYQAIVDQDHELVYTIQYRLSKENGAQEASK